MPHRLITAASAYLLAALGVLLPRLLFYNGGDNAYLAIGSMGIWLVANGFPFALATLLPDGGARRLAVQLGVALIIGIGLVSALLFVWSASLLPGDDVRPEVARAHVITALAALTASAAVLVGCRLVPAAGPVAGRHG